VARSDRRPRQRLDPADRRAALLEAAAAEFARDPYPQVSLGSVARRAEASEPLVYRYFDGKAGLYTAVVEGQIADLTARHDEAQATLAPHVAARDRVRAALLVHLDAVADAPAWGGPLAGSAGDPPAAAAAREAYREAEVARLRAFLLPGQRLRQDLALRGWLGFRDELARRWAAAGTPDDERWPIVETCLGALEGALGDWGR
jgi:AcrR family transcriptional regulator